MELLRVKDAGMKYHISPYTFYRWHWSKKFPGLFAKVGKVLFVDGTELRKIAEESKEKILDG